MQRSSAEVTVSGASALEAAAVVAALERYRHDSASASAAVAPEAVVSPWKRAALLEGVSRRSA